MSDTPILGKLTAVNLRELWSHEAGHFTPWLAAHIDMLGEALGLDLEVLEIEVPIGSFFVDILARDLGSKRTVTIENQLERTDHDHLGKILTYASGKDARVLVWVASEVREEHRQAVEWMNQRTDEDTEFFAVEIRAFRIDDSRPTAEFVVVAGPNRFQKREQSSARTTSSKGEAYRAFFQRLLDSLREDHKFTGARAAQPQNWYSFTSGTRGISYGTAFRWGGQVSVEVYIDIGDASQNARALHSLESRKSEIEARLGMTLQFEKLEDARACRVAAYRAGAIEAGDAELEEISVWIIESLLRFKEVVGPFLPEMYAAATSEE